MFENLELLRLSLGFSGRVVKVRPLYADIQVVFCTVSLSVDVISGVGG